MVIVSHWFCCEYRETTTLSLNWIHWPHVESSLRNWRHFWRPIRSTSHCPKWAGTLCLQKRKRRNAVRKNWNKYYIFFLSFLPSLQSIPISGFNGCNVFLLPFPASPLCNISFFLLWQFFREAYALTFGLRPGERRRRSEDSDSGEVVTVMRTSLSKSEFASALGMRADAVFVKKMFNIVDKDRDGRISFQVRWRLNIWKMIFICNFVFVPLYLSITYCNVYHSYCNILYEFYMRVSPTSY